jgi:thiol-disulfide isomerase/thioredoxin
MKKIVFVFVLTAMIGCNSSKEKPQSNQASMNEQSKLEDMQSEKLNQTVPYEESVMLLGKADRTGLEMEAFKEWFNPGYTEYKPNPEILEKLKPLLKDIEITLFMGTWCEDSHRDVPHFYKILDEVKFDYSRLNVYATSEEKTTPEGYENGKNIIQVPTIIFYKDGKEINRIVEYSIYTIEQDMLDILSGKDYKNPYSE